MQPFGEWLPDMPVLNNPGASNIDGVFPMVGHYRPMRSIVAYSNALTARAQGMFSMRDKDGNVTTFAGDVSKLYKLSGQTFNDVSQTAVTYAVSADSFWGWTQFGDEVIATNLTDNVQTFTPGTSTKFADLAGSPPKAKRIATVRDFVVLGYLSTGANRLHWSAQNDSTGWTAGTNQSDTQTLPDGDAVMAITSGEVGYIVQEKAIRRMVYVGLPLVFQIDKLEENRGTRAAGSVVQVGERFYYLGEDGFYEFDGQRSVPIGTQKVDKTFFADMDSTYLFRITGVSDPINKLVIWSYPSTASVDGTPDKLIIFNWVTRTWAQASISCEMVGTNHVAGYTLEGLDAVSADIDALAFSLDSRAWTGGGLILAAYDTAHKLSFFTGDTLAATLETAEAQIIPGRRAYVSGVTPLVDTTSATSAAGYRERQGDSVVYTSEASMQYTGECPLEASGRYVRARVKIPAATSWNKAQGVDFIAADDGVV